MRTILSVLMLLVAGAVVAQETRDVEFKGTCTDAEDGDLSASLVWVSDIDGDLFTGAEGPGAPGPLYGYGTYPLSLGVHQITATCTDSLGESVSETVSHEVKANTPPSAVIIAPADGGSTVG